MKFAVCLLTFLLQFHGVVLRPQCLDNMPPFRSISELEFCTDYETLGCCTAEKDSELAVKYDNIIANLTRETTEQCGTILKSLICQKCSPYSSRLHEAAEGPKFRDFPALCSKHCEQVVRKCSSIIKYVTSDKNLLEKASNEDVAGFCQAVKASDSDYCYPNVKSDYVLTHKLGTTGFFQKKPWRSEKLCIPMCVKEVASDLYNPLSAKHANDGSNRLFIVEQRGVVWVYSSDFTRSEEPFLDIRHAVLLNENNFDDRGLLDIVFHLDHAENGLFYIYYTVMHEDQQYVKLSEMKVSETDRNKADLNTQRTILVIKQPSIYQNGGQLLFHDDGYLYLSIGDGGPSGDPHGNGQNKTTLLGKVLRIDVNKRDIERKKEYSIPADNPFVGNDEYLPEIYALGIRNMWRCSMDRGDGNGENRGRIFCGDVGQSKWEEVDILEKGGNYGWRAFEGRSCFDKEICNRTFVKNYVPPIHVYDHSVGKSVVGGYVYRGCQNPNLEGKYIFGDAVFGKLNMLTKLPNGNWRKQKICMATSSVCKNGGLSNEYNSFILSFGEDESGELYMLTTNSFIPGEMEGKVYKLIDPSRRGDPMVCDKKMGRKSLVKDEPSA